MAGIKICPVCRAESELTLAACPACGWEFRIFLAGLSQEGQRAYEQEINRRKQALDKPAHGSVWVEPRTGLEFVWLESGDFSRNQWQDRARGVSGPSHQITVSGFWIGKYPVIREQWSYIMKKTPAGTGRSTFPATHITWIETSLLIEKLCTLAEMTGFRLPTEAEWEFACRAGGAGRFCCGDSERDLAEYAWFATNAAHRPHSVGKKQPNAWGLYDLHGNVQEWCQDWFGQYPAKSVRDPQGPVTGACRVYRGGSHLHPAECCASDFRNWDKPGVSAPTIGFRLAISHIQRR